MLSAHQALSNVDLALVRLISNLKSRQVMIFVNRIDELAEPARQVPEIEASIRATLEAHQGPEDCRLIFGSAYWANRALTGELKGMEKASADALPQSSTVSRMRSSPRLIKLRIQTSAQRPNVRTVRIAWTRTGPRRA